VVAAGTAGTAASGRPGVTERDTGGKVATYGAGTKGRFPCWKRYFGLFRCAEAPRRGSFAVLDCTKGAPPVEISTFCSTELASQGYFEPGDARTLPLVSRSVT
jgi:hypothetical protein